MAEVELKHSKFTKAFLPDGQVLDWSYSKEDQFTLSMATQVLFFDPRESTTINTSLEYINRFMKNPERVMQLQSLAYLSRPRCAKRYIHPSAFPPCIRMPQSVSPILLQGSNVTLI